MGLRLLLALALAVGQVGIGSSRSWYLQVAQNNARKVAIHLIQWILNTIPILYFHGMKWICSHIFFHERCIIYIYIYLYIYIHRICIEKLRIYSSTLRQTWQTWHASPNGLFVFQASEIHSKPLPLNDDCEAAMMGIMGMWWNHRDGDDLRNLRCFPWIRRSWIMMNYDEWCNHHESCFECWLAERPASVLLPRIR